MCSAWGFICFINSPVRESKIKAFSLWFSLLALAGCGGGGTDVRPPAPPPPVQTTVSGKVFASDPFYSGVVKAYDFTNGVRGAQLASANIEGSPGSYQLTITGTVPTALLIEADSGCYNEKGIFWRRNVYGPPVMLRSAVATVCTSAPALSAAVPFDATPLTVAVTPYTHAAVGLAQNTMRNGVATATALSDANGRLSAWVGVNIITTLPAAPIRSSSTLTAPLLYGSLLAGIPAWLTTNTSFAPGEVLGVGSMTTLAVAEAMKSDLAHDGVLNGIGSAGALTVAGAPMSTGVYRHQIAVGAVLRIRAETEGASSSPTLEEARSIVSFLPALEAYNNSVNTVVDNLAAVIALDEGGPIVIIGGPLAGATLTYNGGVDGYVNDIVGIQLGATELLIDNIVYTPFTNQYHANNFINTTIFPNGPHLLTIRATNNLGHASTASVTVNFFN